MYNVMWICEETDEGRNDLFIKACNQQELNIKSFYTCQKVKNELDTNLKSWDAIILDSKIRDNKSEKPTTGYMLSLIMYLNNKNDKKIPYYIFYDKDDPIKISNEYKGAVPDYKLYKRGDEEEKLIKNLKSDIAQSEPNQINSLYNDVFLALEFMKIEGSWKSILMPILQALHYPANHTDFKPIHHYNQLRRLVENLFRVCHEYGIVPDECIEDGKVNLSQCSHYLAGHPAELAGVMLKDGKRIVPEHIERIIHSIVELGNTHSHTAELNEEDRVKIEDNLITEKSRYIIFGLALQLCEVITWLTEYIKKHHNKEENLKQCQKIEKEVEGPYLEYEGKIFEPEQDEAGIWHCGECMVMIKYWNGGKVRLKSVCENTNKNTNAKYPLYAKYDNATDQPDGRYLLDERLK